MDEDYNSYEAAIPDGRIKARAIAQAKRAMRDLGIRRALLVVNSMRTSNILDIITVEIISIFLVKDFLIGHFFLLLHYP